MVFILIQIPVEHHNILRIYVDLPATYTKNVLALPISNFFRQFKTASFVFTKLSINHPCLLQNCQHMILYRRITNPFMQSPQFVYIELHSIYHEVSG